MESQLAQHPDSQSVFLMNFQHLHSLATACASVIYIIPNYSCEHNSGHNCCCENKRILSKNRHDLKLILSILPCSAHLLELEFGRIDHPMGEISPDADSSRSACT